jgi:hypothetical protein
MDRLPQELVEKITGLLPHKYLKCVLTLSTRFRYAAERCSGAFKTFTFDESNAVKFLNLYSGHRLSYLRKVKFRPQFPEPRYHKEKERYCRENAQELHEKDESFTQQIKLLFRTLKLVEEGAGELNSPGRYQLFIYSPERQIELGHCPHHEFVSWRVHLLDHESLPKIASIRSLEIHHSGTARRYPFFHDSGEECIDMKSKLDLRVIVDIASRLPNLEFLGCKMGSYEWCSTWYPEEPAKHYEQDWEGPRRDTRLSFAEAVETQISNLAKTLKSVRLDFLYPLADTMHFDQRRKLPDLVHPACRDPFSSSLRVLSYPLQQLQLRVMADETLFWPMGGNVPFWPHLERLDVAFHVAQPNGAWYFQGPRGQGNDKVGFRVTDACYPSLETSDLDRDMDDQLEHWGTITQNCQFRVFPIDENIRPFLAAFAKAAANMPSLKKAALWSPLRFYPLNDLSNEIYPDDVWGRKDHAWGVFFAAPNERCPWSSREDDCPFRQLWWRVAGWRPGSQLHDLFKAVGRERHGEILEENWTGKNGREGLADRKDFEFDLRYHLTG